MNDETLSMAIGAKALDGLTMRMAAIAQNLANAGTPRFQSTTVHFEQALRDAAAKGSQAVSALRFEYTAGPVYDADDDRRLDLLIADASQTAMRYSALVDMLGRRLALRQSALGGRG